MVSDEEILERAFLSALQKHFKKPGPWLPIETIAGNTPWHPVQGQIWEVYTLVSSNQALLLNGSICAAGAATTDSWFPCQATIYDLTSEIGTPGASDTVLVGTSRYLSMDNEGWILSENDVLICAVPWGIRRRRRFDLET